jgi:DNA-directed RNA polymerase subunit RPC12/RpoP
MGKKNQMRKQGNQIEEQDTTLRCLNCFKRMGIALGTERIKCANCGEEYIIGWRGKGKRQAKILGQPIPGKHK